MTTPECFCDALWAAWSWYRFVHAFFELEFVVDGEISKGDRNAAQRLFPGVRVAEAETIVSSLRNSHPFLKSFLENHPLGRKLGVILKLQSERPVLFSDHDVLAFNPPSELLLQTNDGTPFHITEEKEGVFDPEILRRAQELGLKHAPDLNSGLLYVPKGALSMALASQLLAEWHPPMRSWFTEQTVLSVLFNQAGGESLPRQKYVVSNRRQFYWEEDVDYSSITARHFTGPVRHIMYRNGMPEIMPQHKPNKQGWGGIADAKTPDCVMGKFNE
jgi:hypothetical protein